MMERALYRVSDERSSCGVGFITRKDSQQAHEILQLAHQALSNIPHRGGMNAQGIGDGAGVNIDLSLAFFRKILNDDTLQKGQFGVANFFFPFELKNHNAAQVLIETLLEKHQIQLTKVRVTPVNNSVINDDSIKVQQPIYQYIFTPSDSSQSLQEFEQNIELALRDIEAEAYVNQNMEGFYPLSMSARTQVYKGRLNSWEVIPYFQDLSDPDQKIASLFFHTRFSTNTAPATRMAQPFRRMAHNGELNTDKKNRLSEQAIARQLQKQLVFPVGQSDSARLDQTLARRINDDKLDIVTAVLAMMPPAWENDSDLSAEVRAMYEYFSLYEEKNDGPAALVFSDGERIGARLDRLGLRPLRSVETHDYLAVMSEAGQIDFPAHQVVKLGRIEAGGMIVFDHLTKQVLETQKISEQLASKQDYASLLNDARLLIDELPDADTFVDESEFGTFARHVAYSLNQESFKFFLDPMLQQGSEKISAMGYGLAPNALTDEEGGMSKYFSQRFAQVTNPPLDSIREADGMTLRVALGAKPIFSDSGSRQLVIDTPVLLPSQLLKIKAQTSIAVKEVDTLYTPTLSDKSDNAVRLKRQIEQVCTQVEDAARNHTGIVILTDQHLSNEQAAIPALLMIAAVNQHLISHGLRFNTSVLYFTGQAISSHDIACLLGFGASAVCPLSVYLRADTLAVNQSPDRALQAYIKAVNKSLMKTMGKFGLCTAESYIGGEFFESNFLDTQSNGLKQFFPNIKAPVGGARFEDLAWSSARWHFRALAINDEKQVPLLGLFKERQQGAGHSFGNTAVREYINMTQEDISFVAQLEQAESDTIKAEDLAYKGNEIRVRSPEEIDEAVITPSYRSFVANLYQERAIRPAALRDVLVFASDFDQAETEQDFFQQLTRLHVESNVSMAVKGLEVVRLTERNSFTITLVNKLERLSALYRALIDWLDADCIDLLLQPDCIKVVADNQHVELLNKFITVAAPINIEQVEPAHKITAKLASGAMSHGALNANAHQAVAMGTNMAGAISNSGEGGEHSSRFNSIKASKIKQFASGRFGVWTGYLADPTLEEIEIKIAQGAKPGEGGQLPAKKVTVEIAAARGGTPGVELVSPPPHHDTYSIEDLGQLIHDAKAARVKVVVKLVSSEGIGTIAVGVAKAGADVINVAGNTGGTGAAAVTSLKNTGRAAELGIVEVHQALSENGLREKITLRCSNAHQTGMDVVKSAIMGADSFEFGTTALMMLKCVMAKNCNVKCPAGLTTNPELYQGDPRALAQYFINIAHEIREILADLGYRSLREIRGESQLLSLANHQALVGHLDMSALLSKPNHLQIESPVYLEADFSADDHIFAQFKNWYDRAENNVLQIEIDKLNNRNKTVGGQFSIDIERLLNSAHRKELPMKEGQGYTAHPAVYKNPNGRKVFAPETITVHTQGSAGQSYGAFNNSGIKLIHLGTCNDGVGKGQSGGHIVIKDACGLKSGQGERVLVGNFALFGATGGKTFIEGEVGDRFAVRNSGATAVVEGTGDFCCEYMTNGCVINLGMTGKGMGNGMSGGIAYQYDPSEQAVANTSQDSVKAVPLTEHNPGYEVALKLHLQEHIKHTGSVLASEILANWQVSKQHFKIIFPLALLNSQYPEYVLAHSTRKQMLQELIEGSSEIMLNQLHHAYLKGGADINVPGYGDIDSESQCRLITLAGLTRRAFEATELGKISGLKRQIEFKEKKLLDAVYKDVKYALENYDDCALSVLLAHQRVEQYKSSLARRDVDDSHPFATSVWIIARAEELKKELDGIPSFYQSMATHYCHVFAECIREEMLSEVV